MIILAHEWTRNDSVNLTTSTWRGQACFLSSLSLAMEADPKTMYRQCLNLDNFDGKFLYIFLLFIYFLTTLFSCLYTDENL